ncbi:ester cyclase [Mesorhizobium sp.]|uniref:ester cyclase n=1 Tax=Mesorhizobium sp. TaxID=1871066 RepID=UPI000FE2E48E|nr:ester cyclase [Mesorhizobium sp.]RWH72892.1 MAG: hypothetical protein EOQ84_11815 [Mesorhizobium sp.]RWL34222.1 MAG: hypothetical protein EOR58_00190 [Mesorhizobium sp.]RWL35638.1 MAG: hypothetical protein EOR63_02770 [Mesorhizobium sp.]RWL41048.1 MAG: hypothetical protein EOR59_00195 [Mesorhizobium sp.]RWL52186.1 MAG: hypothetical protein EOR62_18850 [Mesorhizobium sp.]
MALKLSRDELVARIVKAGEAEVHGAWAEEIALYFDPERFRFHGPDGFESDYQGLQEYFAALRAAFDDLSIRRGIVVVEGNELACQTWIEGRFVRQFAMSPIGSLPPNHERITWDLINIFRVDDEGRLIEEFVRTDNRSLLRQLAAAGR